MNPEDFSRTDLIEALSPVLAAVGSLFFGALWFASLLLRRWAQRFDVAISVFGFLVATASLWFAFQCMGAIFSLATSWSLPVIAVIGALAAEAVLWIYAFEKSLVSKKRGRFLLALRLGALAVLILILVQPVRSFIEEREISSEVAILIDDSDSMGLSDQRLSASQSLDRAALREVPGLEARPPLDAISKQARQLDNLFQTELGALRSAPTPSAGLENRAAQLPEFFKSVEVLRIALTESLTRALSTPLPGGAKPKLDDYLKRTRDGLSRILHLADKAAQGGQAEELTKQLEVARTEIAGILDTIGNTISSSDEAFYKNLDEPTRKLVDSAAAASRRELARNVLEARPSKAEELTQEGQVTRSTLLDELKQRYNLRYYLFSRDVTQISDPLAAGDGDSDASSIGTKVENAQTDLTGALEHVLDTTAPESLAGVLVLSDGRHNGSGLPEDSLRQLAVRNTPLTAVPLGGDLGPVDISLLSLNAPESIYLDDRVAVKATAKLDGFLGEKVEAELLSGGEVIDTVSIDVTDVSFRTEINFIDKPETKGIQNYQVRLRHDPREIFQENNAWDFKVAVTDDRTNVLLIDGFPRWEFRYLRNLFYGRDKSVHLQYVLLDPDEIYR